MTAQLETRAITIHVSDRVYAGLIERGRKAGYTPTLYAKLLFEAAYAARCGTGEADPLLEVCVAKSLDRRPAAPIAPPAPLPIPRPVPIPVAMPVLIPVVVQVRSVEATEPVPAAPTDVEHLAATISEGAAKLEAEMRGASPKRAPAPARPATAEKWSASEFIFARLVCREEGVSLREVQAALAPGYQAKKSLFILVSAVRKKLAKTGVAFEPVDIWGWRVERASRAAADAFLARIG